MSCPIDLDCNVLPRYSTFLSRYHSILVNGLTNCGRQKQVQSRKTSWRPQGFTITRLEEKQNYFLSVCTQVLPFVTKKCWQCRVSETTGSTFVRWEWILCRTSKKSIGTTNFIRAATQVSSLLSFKDISTIWSQLGSVRPLNWMGLLKTSSTNSWHCFNKPMIALLWAVLPNSAILIRKRLWLSRDISYSQRSAWTWKAVLHFSVEER